MNIEIVVQNNKDGQIYDISSLVTDISYDTSLDSQPSRLTFTYIVDALATFPAGSIVSFKIEGIGVFFGYIFKQTLTEKEKVQVIAYDQTRYLKNKDTYVFNNKNIVQIFTKLCDDFNLSYKIVDNTDYILAPRIYDNKTLYDIINWGIDETLIKTGNWYTIRDNFGTLEFVNLNSLKTDIYFGDKQSLLAYNFENSIDMNTYNQVKLIKENKETIKRELYLVKDSNNIKKWGLLQYFEKMDENANEAQIKERAEKLLKLKNRTTKTLKIECIGDINIKAGNGIILDIADLQEYEVERNQYFMVINCTHNFKNNQHIMNLELQVSI